jgi:hypothetical protein
MNGEPNYIVSGGLDGVVDYSLQPPSKIRRKKDKSSKTNTTAGQYAGKQIEFIVRFINHSTGTPLQDSLTRWLPKRKSFDFCWKK